MPLPDLDRADPARAGTRAVGLGTALVPAATLYVLAFGVTAPSWTFEVTTIFDDGHSTTSGGSLLPGAGQLEAFWLAVAIVVGAAVFALVASRQAAYIAAVSLLVFGLWQMYVAVKLQAGLVGGYYWYDFLLRWTDRPVVWLVALASLVSGLFLAERTMVADALGRRSGLASRVELLTQTRAEAPTPPRPNCAAWSGTCTTAHRPGWSRSASACGRWRR